MRRLSYKTYVLALLIVVLGMVVISGIYVAKNDPYWAWRKVPPWYRQGGGYNRVLDTRQRFAKAIQIVTRQPDVIIIGSSRAYRGINTEGQHAQRWYNAGIPSLRIREIDAYIRHVLHWTPVKTIVLGLDYFMFDTNVQSLPGFDENLGGYTFLFKAIPTSLFSRMAYKDTRRALKGRRNPDGYWTYSGFKITNLRSQAVVEEGLQRLNAKKIALTPAEYDVYSGILEYVQQHEVRLIVFLSPINIRQLEGMMDDGEYADFMVWRDRVGTMTREHGVAFYDFSLNNPFFIDRITAGSTPYWIDTSHYSPVVGAWILRSIGLR